MGPSNHSDQEELPIRIGGYRIVRRLGGDPCREAFLARDEQLNRWLVVKRLKMGPGVSAHGRRRFQAEANAAIQLEHPAIVKIYAFLEEEDCGHLISEFVQARSLARIQQDAHFDQASIVQIVLQLAQGLAVAHGQGIVHRDLRSENILLTRCGQAKILDFGVARRLAVSSEAPGNQTWDVRSLSPEQARGDQTGPSTDYFSLGLMIYELISQCNPFCGKTLAKTLNNIQHQLPTPLQNVSPGTHPKLSSLVDWLLQKDPQRRPETAHDLILPLQEIANELGALKPTSSYPPSAL